MKFVNDAVHFFITEFETDKIPPRERDVEVHGTSTVQCKQKTSSATAAAAATAFSTAATAAAATDVLPSACSRACFSTTNFFGFRI